MTALSNALESWRGLSDDERREYLVWLSGSPVRPSPASIKAALALLREAGEPEPCHPCKGTGGERGVSTDPCQECEGTGVAVICSCTITRHERQENRACPVHFQKCKAAGCETCGGQGRYIVDTRSGWRLCGTCNGSGR